MPVDSRRPAGILVPVPSGPARRRSASLGSFADPLAVDAAEGEVHPYVRGHDAKDGLVLLGAGPVDDLHEGELVDLDARTLGLERPPRGGLEHAALPAPVRGPCIGE